MRGGVTPLVLLFAALGVALSIAPRTIWGPSLLALLLALAAFAFLPLPHAWLEGVFLGCWISVIGTAASVQVFHKVSACAAFILSINTGAWSSAVADLSGSHLNLLEALPWATIVWPASWVVRRYGSIPIKIVSSWLIAIAALSGVLQFLPATPGYLPDHME